MEWVMVMDLSGKKCSIISKYENNQVGFNTDLAIFLIKHENHAICVWLACSLFLIPMKRHKRE